MRMEGLTRFAWKYQAEALCDVAGSECFLAQHQSSEVTGAKARDHTRETGHTTRVYHRHVTVYRAEPGRRAAR